MIELKEVLREMEASQFLHEMSMLRLSRQAKSCDEAVCWSYVNPSHTMVRTFSSPGMGDGAAQGRPARIFPIYVLKPYRYVDLGYCVFRWSSLMWNMY